MACKLAHDFTVLKTQRIKILCCQGTSVRWGRFWKCTMEWERRGRMTNFSSCLESPQSGGVPLRRYSVGSLHVVNLSQKLETKPPFLCDRQLLTKPLWKESQWNAKWKKENCLALVFSIWIESSCEISKIVQGLAAKPWYFNGSEVLQLAGKTRF